MELYFKTRGEWRNWLDENHSKVKGVWLVYYKKSSGKPRIPYNDAVEEALCYGWIDGKIKRVNEDAKREVTRAGRIAKIVTRSEKNIKAGMM